jgi:hypothetical protein
MININQYDLELIEMSSLATADVPYIMSNEFVDVCNDYRVIIVIIYISILITFIEAILWYYAISRFQNGYDEKTLKVRISEK